MEIDKPLDFFWDILYMIASRIGRLFSTSAARMSGHGHGPDGGIPGINLPFDISNKYKLTAYFVIYCGSAMSIPFLVLRHALTK
ncbi:cytochrome c oxidase subunit 7C, mitochondrial-like [Macrosteles quadrilineatus]|uniref:cytochrome c oxidase subunit 7C, mitochondrial-like n=1 Tax=Macrosteles quadrilineatus TaxID=74068 RepID=UPI0023E12D0D|nr:cytochrome c oxidase subunit 7C, mitochondrial-like [Macrosteles quadrilineatus]